MTDLNKPYDPDKHSEDAQKFMRALFGPIEEDASLHALLWTMPDKHSTWGPAHHADGIASAAVALAAQDKDVYVAVSCAASLAPVSRRGKERIRAESSAGLMGLWADIDVADPDVHKKWNLPGTIDEAWDLVHSLGLDPTIVVHSGHGLQAWWLFNEFLVFDSDDDRRLAASLAQRWHTTLRVKAAEKKWTVDSVFDLSRVMRVPGTFNRKGERNGTGPVLPVRLLKNSPVRYDPEDFDAYCVDSSVLADRGMLPTRGYVTGDLVLNQNANPPADAMEAARDNSPVFDQTWNRKRPLKDFPDQTGSAYDMSLASQAAAFGWTDQEIADLLIAHRRKHKDNLEKVVKRQDYIQRTIAKARDTKFQAEAQEVLEDAAAELDAANETQDQEDQDDARRKVLDAFGAQLGIEVTQIVRYMSDPPTFRLVTPTHTVELGGPEDVRRMDRFTTAVWSAIGHQIPRFKMPQWDALTAVMPKAWREVEVGAEATEHGQVESWIAGYLQDRPPAPSSDEGWAEQTSFFTKDAKTAFFGPAFRTYLWTRFQERVPAKEMGRLLRNYGAVPQTLDVKSDTKSGRSSKSIWILPKGWERSDLVDDLAA